MNFLNPTEVILNYVEAGKKKAERPLGKMILLAILAGMLIAFGGVVSNTAVHAIQNLGVARLVSGLVWPIGLAIVMLLGGELFLGNTMMVVSVLDKKTNLRALLKNWFFVYLGNLFGGLTISAMIAASGQLRLNEGSLAIFTIKTAVNKVSMGFGAAVLMGILCNLLVCAAVLCSSTAKDTAGRIMGAYIPIFYFITGGFENAVANMYLAPVGIFALKVPEYAQHANAIGIDTSVLTWGNIFAQNLLPVTIGNIIGGVAIGVIMWCGHLQPHRREATDIALRKGLSGASEAL
ncbi:MAG: formate/nitrite transporter family protein [Clostridiales bacterium]|jgi:formate/nitrite transporter|nr:formate/nitrite transporter family protein [Clostridiales bacterium]